MHILCPHCHNAIELVRLVPREEISCPGCGSSFRLEGDSTTGWNPQANQKFGKFELIDTVGTGAFGTVYKARDPELDRVVAIKVPRAGNLASGQELDRFLREARSVARLRHPSIVPVHEVGQQDGTPYLVSEFVSGMTLADLLSGRRPTAHEAADLLAAVADALQYAHEQGVVHRDVKPSNILLDGEGRPHLMDFGLAKRDAGEVTMTIDGQVLGTPAYMSPEQARGEAHRVDGRSDVYSLGVILYQMLTGELPFRGTARMLLHQVLHDEPRPPRSLNDRIPRDLQTICLKALAKEPHRRYASAQELAADLRRFRHGEPILARPVGAVERGWRWCRRNPIVAGLTAAVVLVTAIGFGATYWKYRDAEHQRGVAERQRQLAEDEKGKAEKAEKDATGRAEAEARAKTEAQTARRQAEVEKTRAEHQRDRAEWLVYTGKLALAQREWQDGNVAHARDLLDSCRWDLRGWEHAYLNTLVNHLGQRTLQGNAGALTCVAFSPDGMHLASASQDLGDRPTWGVVKVWDVRSGKETLILKGHMSAVTSVAFSPDGLRLASAGEDKVLRVWDANTGQEILTLHGHQDMVFGLAISGDSRRLASASMDGTVRIWDARTGQELATLRGHLGPVGSVAFSPDSRRLASAGGDGTVTVWDVATRQETLTIEGHPNIIASVVFSPDGRRLAGASWDKTVKLWDVEKRQEILTFKGHTDIVASVAFSPDGRRLASASWDGTVMVWDVATARVTHTFKGHTDHVLSVAFSPDGGRLASGGRDQTVKLWDVRTGQDTLSLKAAVGTVFCAAFSPDGRRLASASGSFDSRKIREVKVWDARSGQELFSLWGKTKEDNWQAINVAFSPDSLRLATTAVGLHQTVKVRDARTGQEVLTFEEDTGPVNGVAFSPDGQHLASAGRDQTVKVWNAQTGQRMLTLSGHTDEVLSVAFSSDGRRLASASRDKTIKVWDVLTSQETSTLKGHRGWVTTVAFSPDGRRLASASLDGTVKVWDARTGQEALTLRGHSGWGTSVTFSLDGLRLAYPWDDRVKVWDARAGQETLSLRAHVTEIISMGSSPDGHRLISKGLLPDGKAEVRAWDMQTGQEIVPCTDPAPTARSRIVHGPDGKWTASSQGSIIHVRRRGGLQAVPSQHQCEEDLLCTLFWHGQEAEAAGKEGYWVAAAFHLERLRAYRPTDPDHLARRGRVQLAVGQLEAYRQSCAQLVDNYSLRAHAALTGLAWSAAPGDALGTTAALAASGSVFLERERARDFAARTCVLLPSAVPDTARLLPLADGADVVTRGAILCRAGRHAEAAQVLAGTQLPEGMLYLALVEHARGNRAAARQLLERVERWSSLPSPIGPKLINAAHLPWEQQLEIDLLRREVESLLHPAELLPPPRVEK